MPMRRKAAKIRERGGAISPAPLAEMGSLDVGTGFTG
jgi:hypothetical protein